MRCAHPDELVNVPLSLHAEPAWNHHLRHRVQRQDHAPFRNPHRSLPFHQTPGSWIL